MAKKRYRMNGTSPILIEGFGRIEPGHDPFVCEMSDVWERWFLKIGALEVLAIVTDDTPESEPSKPSSPAWPGETVLAEYKS